MRATILLLLSMAPAFSLTIQDIAEIPGIAKASADLVAAEVAYVDTVVGVVNSWHITQVPELELGPDPRESELEKAKQIRNYNGLTTMISHLQRFKKRDAQEGDWRKQLLTEVWLIKRRRDEAIACGAVRAVDASGPDKVKPKSKIRAKLADGTIVESE